MLKELKYFFFIFIIVSFTFFLAKYYFSDINKKKSYRVFNNLNGYILKNKNNLNVLNNDTENIIEYVEKNLNKKRKKYFFWELLSNDY